MFIAMIYVFFWVFFNMEKPHNKTRKVIQRPSLPCPLVSVRLHIMPDLAKRRMDHLAHTEAILRNLNNTNEEKKHRAL